MPRIATNPHFSPAVEEIVAVVKLANVTPIVVAVRNRVVATARPACCVGLFDTMKSVEVKPNENPVPTWLRLVLRLSVTSEVACTGIEVGVLVDAAVAMTPPATPRPSAACALPTGCPAGVAP